MVEDENIQIKVSKPLIEKLREKYPSWREIPTTYIVDMVLREKLEEKEA